jgi:hypothetical protein
MTGVQALEDELIHARVYDPQKAHEYYLRTRHLKGRSRSGVDISSRPGGDGRQGGTGGSSNAVLRDSSREELEARVEELRNKVEQVRELIRIRVGRAKKRAGVDEPKEKEDSSSSTTKDKKSTDTKDSTDKPLTEKQKADKRKASKEQYEKEKGTSLAREAEALRNTLQNLRERLEKLPKPANNEQLQGGRSDQRDGGNGR